MRRYLVFTFLIFPTFLWSQVTIASVSSMSTFPGDTLVITGSGFSSIPDSNQVWFGQVQGSIISSSGFSIEVAVPPQAKYAAIEVVNLTTKYSAKTTGKFHPYFSGNAFSPAAMIAQTTTSPNQLYDLCSCDFNLDGKPDVASSKFDFATDILVMKNQSSVGALSFVTQSVPVGVFTEEIVCGDLNGDGKPELVASRSGGASGAQRNAVFILPNTSTIGGAISFGAALNRAFPEGHARYVMIRDLNADGKPEIIVSNSASSNMYVFINESSGGTLCINPTPLQFSIFDPATPNTSPNSFGLEVQDMDGDLKPEIIVTQFRNANIYILKNQSTSTISFAAPIVKNFPGAFNKLIAADFNEDGKMDLAATDWANSDLVIFLNMSSSGVISFAAPIKYGTGDQPDGMDVGDIDGDQDIDIVLASRGQNLVDVFLNDGVNSSLSFTRAQVPTSKNQRNVILSDLDGDAKPEIAVTSYNLSFQYSIDILRNKNCFVPVILTPSPLTVCLGQTAFLESIPGYGVTFEWKNGATVVPSSSNRFFSTTVAGSYTVSGISEGSCNTPSNALTLKTDGMGIIPPNPAITTSPQVCSEKNLILSATSVNSATYNWTGPNNFSATSNVSSTTISAITPAGAGRYTLVISIGMCKSNPVSSIIDVVNISGFSINSSSSTNSTCQGTPLVLSTANTNGFGYQWIQNGADVSGQTASSISVSGTGDYKVRVSYPSIVGCSKETAVVPVKVLALPSVSFTTSSPLCTSSDIVFSSSASVFDPNGTPVYSWTFGDNSSSTVAAPTHVFATAQSFNVSLTGSYLGVAGCSASDNQSITINTRVIPTIVPSLTSICPGETAILNVSGGPFSDFLWDDLDLTTENPLNVTDSGTFTVTVTDANGCKAMASQVITIKPSPTITISADPLFANSGQFVQLLATGGESYDWSPLETIDNPKIANPVATPLSTTTYTVYASVEGQCTIEKSVLITVNGDLKFPNVFSPNGDSKNDTWIIPGSENMTECTLSIFDKSGVRIIEQKANEDAWDGTYSGKPVPPGTYFYIINCPNNNPITGHILVAR